MPETINPNIITPTQNIPTTAAGTPNVSSLVSTIQPTAANVYSPQNVQQAISTPQQAPNLNDPLGMLTTIQNNLGLSGLKQQEQAIAAQVQQANQAARAQQSALGNLPQALNVIRGEQAVAGEQANLGLQALSEQLGVAQTARLSAEQQAQQQFDVLNAERQNKINLATQYPGAKISVYDNYDQINKKIVKYQEQVAKDEYKSQLKQMAMQLGVKTKGSTKEIEKRVSKYYKSQKEFEAQMNALDMAAKQKSLRGSSPVSKNIQAEIMTMKDSGMSWGDAAKAIQMKYGMMPGDEKSQIMDYVYGGKIPQQQVTPIKQVGDWVYFSDGTRENQTTGEIQQQQ